MTMSEKGNKFFPEVSVHYYRSNTGAKKPLEPRRDLDFDTFILYLAASQRLGSVRVQVVLHVTHMYSISLKN